MLVESQVKRAYERIEVVGRHIAYAQLHVHLAEERVEPLRLGFGLLFRQHKLIAALWLGKEIDLENAQMAHHHARFVDLQLAFKPSVGGHGAAPHLALGVGDVVGIDEKLQLVAAVRWRVALHANLRPGHQRCDCPKDKA